MSDDRVLAGLCGECGDEVYLNIPHACWGSSPQSIRDRRFSLARDILLKLLSAPDDEWIQEPEQAAEMSVAAADALLAELAKPKEASP